MLFSLCYSSLGLWNDALRDAKRCLFINDKYMKGYYRTAIVYQTLGNYDNALEIIRDGLKLFPDNSDLLRMAEKLELHMIVNALKTDGDLKFNHDDFEGAICSYTACIDKLSNEVL